MLPIASSKAFQGGGSVQLGSERADQRKDQDLEGSRDTGRLCHQILCCLLSCGGLHWCAWFWRLETHCHWLHLSGIREQTFRYPSCCLWPHWTQQLPFWCCCSSECTGTQDWAACIFNVSHEDLHLKHCSLSHHFDRFLWQVAE